MSISRKFLWRLGLWSLLMLYIALDLLIFKGPVDKIASKLSNDQPKFEDDSQRGIAARVFNRPIYLSQIDFAVDQKLWATGKTRAGIQDKQRLFLRAEALRNIADQYILREKVRLNSDDYPVSEKEINAAVLRFAARFKSTQEMTTALKAYGFQGEKELRFRLAAQLQQEKYILAKIQPGIAVTDDDAKKWYDDFKEKTITPERVRVQHTFISRLPAPGQTAKEKEIYAIKNLITANKYVNEIQFGKLAAKFSEDEHTKNNGGNLGWIHRGRIAKDFTDACFATKLNTPETIETKLGWHLINVLEKQPARTRSYEEMKPEIVIAIETIRRHEQIEIYRVNLRRQHGDYIRTNWVTVAGPWTK
ncbi:MAG: peptidyl-prolyl cis-trans isomerase C [Cryomorphaceae bacterium]|jgi:peptidyl-prolyl cis-trans isomerase C